MTVYGLVLWVFLFFSYAPFLIWLQPAVFYYYASLVKGAGPHIESSLIGKAGLVNAICVVLLAMLIRLITAPSLFRRLVRRPKYSPLNILKPNAFWVWNHQNAGNTETPRGQRPGQGLLNLCLKKYTQARSRRQYKRAGVWTAVFFGLAGAVFRQRLFLWGFGLSCILFIVLVGYYNSRAIARCDMDMIDWYPAMAFLFSSLGMLLLQPMRIRPLGLTPCRRSVETSVYLLLGCTVLVVLLLSATIMGIFWILGLIMPQLTIDGTSWAFCPPTKPYVPWLPILSLPYPLIIAYLWRKKGAMSVLVGANQVLFILLHGLIITAPDGTFALVVCSSIVAWLSLPFVVRRRLYHWDHSNNCPLS